MPITHHCAVTGASYILFIAASENTIIISALVTVYPGHRSIYHYLLNVVYDCSLKWAYESAWKNIRNLMSHLPTIWYALISCWNYPVDEDSLCYQYCIWCILKGHVKTTKLPLPCAVWILLHTVTKWNRCKEQIDKMMHFLDGMNFLFSKGSPKQVLLICQQKKKVIATAFAMKH